MRHGDPLGGQFPVEAEIRFWRYVDQTSDCWNWTGSTRIGGGGIGRYGKLRLSRLDGSVAAHRFSYELAFGPIPGDLVIDHMCHNTLCVRPDHLRAVTRKQNSENRSGPMRGTMSGVRGVSWSGGKWMAAVTHEGRSINAGMFDTIEEAAEAARAKRMELFTCNDRDYA